MSNNEYEIDASRILFVAHAAGFRAPQIIFNDAPAIILTYDGYTDATGPMEAVAAYTLESAAEVIAWLQEIAEEMGALPALIARVDQRRARIRKHVDKCPSRHVITGTGGMNVSHNHPESDCVE
ncbi:MAG TPA: hypothetical protein VF178_00805 [Gemmatimonadaceae bacterium]